MPRTKLERRVLLRLALLSPLMVGCAGKEQSPVSLVAYHLGEKGFGGERSEGMVGSNRESEGIAGAKSVSFEKEEMNILPLEAKVTSYLEGGANGNLHIEVDVTSLDPDIALRLSQFNQSTLEYSPLPDGLHFESYLIIEEVPPSGS